MELVKSDIPFGIPRGNCKKEQYLYLGGSHCRTAYIKSVHELAVGYHLKIPPQRWAHVHILLYLCAANKIRTLTLFHVVSRAKEVRVDSVLPFFCFTSRRFWRKR